MILHNSSSRDIPDHHTARVGTTSMSVKTRGRPTEIQGRTSQHGRLLEGDNLREESFAPLPTHHDQPRASSRINDNYCVTKLRARLLAGSSRPTQTINTCASLNVNSPVVKVVNSVPGHSQKRDLSPGSAGCYCKEHKLKYVKSVSCVTQLSCVNPVINVKNAAQILLVRARLQNYWQTWLKLGAGPKVVQILKEGYTLPFEPDQI